MNSALGQIGEPRLDSGYIPPGDIKPKFDPLAPLLPEELCWIIDRAFFYEVPSPPLIAFISLSAHDDRWNGTTAISCPTPS